MECTAEKCRSVNPCAVQDNTVLCSEQRPQSSPVQFVTATWHNLNTISTGSGSSLSLCIKTLLFTAGSRGAGIDKLTWSL